MMTNSSPTFNVYLDYKAFDNNNNYNNSDLNNNKKENKIKDKKDCI